MAGTPLSVLGLHPRSLSVLRSARIDSVEEACSWTDDQLLALPGFGPVGLQKLRDWGALRKAADGGPGGVAEVPRGFFDRRGALGGGSPLNGLEGKEELGAVVDVQGLFDRMQAGRAGLPGRPAFDLTAFAIHTYAQLTEKNGYGTQHAKAAWDGALAFHEEREKALAKLNQSEAE